MLQQIVTQYYAVGDPKPTGVFVLGGNGTKCAP